MRLSRIQQVKITSCYQCNLFKTVDEYSSHQYWCPCSGLSVIVTDTESSEMANIELVKWFQNCKIWELK